MRLMTFLSKKNGITKKGKNDVLGTSFFFLHCKINVGFQFPSLFAIPMKIVILHNILRMAFDEGAEVGFADL